MLKKTLIFLAAYLVTLSPSLLAQVQLGGHVYVPSTTDSTNGMTVLDLNGAVGTCNLVVASSGCTLLNSEFGTAGPDAPWVGTISMTGSVSGNVVIYLPYTPGRFYTIINPFSSLSQFTAQAWDVPSSSPEGDFVVIPAHGSITLWASINASGEDSYEPVGGPSSKLYLRGFHLR